MKKGDKPTEFVYYNGIVWMEWNGYPIIDVVHVLHFTAQIVMQLLTLLTQLNEIEMIFFCLFQS